MCRQSVNYGETKTWCGMGWTGQPTISERDDVGGAARTWAIFGGYDGNIHFMDAGSGQRLLPDVETGDIIKGTPTVDPDGFPLVYSGSRDDLLRVIAFDRPGQAEVLWTLDSESVQPVIWNDDWDSSPIVLGDYLVVGSESGRFWVIKLNRSTDGAGLVQVDPQVVFTTEAWDQEVLGANGDDVASVESLRHGLRQHRLLRHLSRAGVGLRPRARCPTGASLSRCSASGPAATTTHRSSSTTRASSTSPASTTATCHVRARSARSPSSTRPSQPTRWCGRSTTRARSRAVSTARPGISGDVVYFGTNGGRLVAADRATGAIIWEKRIPAPVWGSPVIVDDTLLIGDCEGFLHAYDVSDPAVDPPERLVGRAGWLHRGDTRGLGRPHLHRQPQRPPLRAGRRRLPRPRRRRQPPADPRISRPRRSSRPRSSAAPRSWWCLAPSPAVRRASPPRDGRGTRAG